jgi:thioredoxin 2
MNTLAICSSCGAKNRIPAGKQHLSAKCGRCGERLGTPGQTGVIELTDLNFKEIVTDSSLPVLVDFYSPSCGPCKALAPVIEQLAGHYAGRVVVCKLDTSRYQMAAAQFQIRGVPTLIFFKNGESVDQLVGAAPVQELQQRLDGLL